MLKGKKTDGDKIALLGSRETLITGFAQSCNCVIESFLQADSENCNMHPVEKVLYQL